ncbi:sensor histidine kinase [Thermochromatium tepidum]|uniref:histidine kinase n=1 Tax=Thermochromatium tepidum ATCC 43061 TaxID=316276 RepID=A0A6I6EAX7_THETI|nr:HAMP domain-containing sensor histidine kinase [Thermochromatium tepidum]QGU33778.1 sensor histidine kinase [Thermochromatium tepidum ATCC 43061]
MRPCSLRTRLWLGALISITLAILIAWIGLANLFERHVERHLGFELEVRLNQLAAAVAIAPDGAIRLTQEPRDPSFAQPLSGHYWQIDRPGRPGVLRSRSLWDEVLVLPDDGLALGQIHAHRLPGPGGQSLLVRERRIRVEARPEPVALRLILAQDRAELRAARANFAADMRPYLGLIALLLLLATLIQIQTGLAPLEALRHEIGAIRTGRAARLTVTDPAEVRPLIAEINALLEARDRSVERARAWIADLAHGLKTPLGVLAADAERLRQAGHPDLAADLDQLALTMRRRLERELIRARVRAGHPPHAARAEVVASLERLRRTLGRTPAGEGLDWRILAPEEVAVALMAEDLLELLGNLLENATKWARERVEIQVSRPLGTRRQVEIRIADDGPGVPPEHWPRLGERGLRLDERAAGTGLGLAIVRDLVEAYGGTLGFGRAELGGLLVWVRLPEATV